MPKRWFDTLPPSHLAHRAFDDAIEQGKLFLQHAEGSERGGVRDGAEIGQKRMHLPKPLE